MALPHTFEKTRKDIEKKLSDATPLYVLAGVSDFTAEKLRGARTGITTRVEAFDPKALRDQAQSVIATRVGSLEDDIKSAPAKAQALPAKAQEALGDVVHVATTTAVCAYEDFADRGKNLVTRVRRQSATEELSDQVDSTVSKVKAATTTAKKSAAATKKSADETVAAAKKSADETVATAKKSAAKTRSAAKGATTSAKKTAKAATKAASDAADKVGD